MSTPQEYSRIIKSLSKEFGFSFCGISKAEFLEKEANKLEKWLSNGFHGEMQYLENYFDMRLDPAKLIPGAKTVVSLMYNYYPEKKQNPDSFKLAKYAYGEDYHFVVKDKMKDLLSAIQKQIGNINGRVFVDSAPVMERVWAEKSGIGWIGKHGLLINKQAGSFFFLAELIIDLECESDGPIKNYCGSCTKCIDACPTEAILPNKTLNASKCISYLTIELKSAIPDEFENKLDNWMFGCDICQDVCPWNRFSTRHSENRFLPKEGLLEMDKRAWTEITDDVFNQLFKKSAVKRTKIEGLKRNIKFLNKNSFE